MRRRLVAVVAVVLAFTSGVGALLTRLFTPHPTVNTIAALDPVGGAALLVTLVNREREGAGLAPLLTAENLTECARLRAGDMANRDVLSHTAADDPDPTHYAYLRILVAWQVPLVLSGENAGRLVWPADGDTARAVAQLHQSWMQSQSHRENVLGERFTRIGAGLALSATEQLYAAVVFSREQQDE